MANQSELSELKLHDHIENTPLGVIMWDKNGAINYWSSRATEIFGWSEEETKSTRIPDLLAVREEDLALFQSILLDLGSGKLQRRQFVTCNRTKEGKLIYCEWYSSVLPDKSGSALSILSMVQDVTRREQAAEALKKSQEHLSLMYNTAIDPMWIIDVEEGLQFRFDFINKSFITVTGLAEEKVVGRLIEEVMPADSHALVRSKYTEAVRTGNIIDYVEIARHPAGQKAGEIRVIPVKDGHAEIVKLVCIAHDITENRLLQKKMNEEREEFNKKIIAATVRAQERERAIVSRELHDNVNQVLTTIKLYTELCHSGVVDLNEMLPKCISLLNGTINEIRDLSKVLSQPSIEVAGLQDTLKDLADSVMATQKVLIHLKMEKFSCRLIDSDLHLAIYRIVQEQMTNILKYAEARNVVLHVALKNSDLFLTIDDDGKGFDMAKRRSGIGINNMMRRTQMLNGSFEIQSSPGKGSLLTAVFPIEVVNDKCNPRLL